MSNDNVRQAPQQVSESASATKEIEEFFARVAAGGVQPRMRSVRSLPVRYRRRRSLACHHQQRPAFHQTQSYRSIAGGLCCHCDRRGLSAASTPRKLPEHLRWIAPGTHPSHWRSSLCGGCLRQLCGRTSERNQRATRV